MLLLLIILITSSYVIFQYLNLKKLSAYTSNYNEKVMAVSSTRNANEVQLYVEVNARNQIVGSTLKYSKNVNWTSNTPVTDPATRYIRISPVSKTANVNITLVKVLPLILNTDAFNTTGSIVYGQEKNTNRRTLVYTVAPNSALGTTVLPSSFKVTSLNGGTTSTLNTNNIQSNNVTSLFSSTSGETRTQDQTLDIVIINAGYGASQMSDYIRNADSVTKNILTGSFFNKYQDRYNIYRVDTYHDLSEFGCNLSGRIYWCTQSWQIHLASLEAPAADAVIVLANYNGYYGASTKGPGYVVLTTLGASAVVHELGHQIGSLDDEYVYPELSNTSMSGSNRINCKTTCSAFDPQWTIAGTCSLGCTFGLNAYRSTSDSIMRTVSASFNTLGEFAMQNGLYGYAPTLNGLILPAISSPLPGSTLNVGNIAVSWTQGQNLPSGQYYLKAGTTRTTNDITCSYTGTGLSTTCTVPNNIPMIYLKIGTMVNNTYVYNAYPYYIPKVAAIVASPPANSTIRIGSVISLTPGNGVSGYVVDIDSPTYGKVFQKSLGTSTSLTLDTYWPSFTGGTTSFPVVLTLTTYYGDGTSENRQYNYTWYRGNVGIE